MSAPSLNAHVIDADIETFIDAELKELQKYDAKRPPNHPYAFHTHSVRVARDMRSLARKMGYNEAHADILYRLTLVHDIGKRTFKNIEIWDIEGKPSDEQKAQRREHTTKGVELVDGRFGAHDQRPVLMMMRDLMQNHHVPVNAIDPETKKPYVLSQIVRMLAICDAFDGYSTARPHFGERDITTESVLKRLAEEKHDEYDQALVRIFAEMKMAQPLPAHKKRNTSQIHAKI
jgi:putative nucleotidyltransferase with HDIG domain